MPASIANMQANFFEMVPSSARDALVVEAVYLADHFHTAGSRPPLHCRFYILISITTRPEIRDSHDIVHTSQPRELIFAKYISVDSSDSCTVDSGNTDVFYEAS